ncbi:DNA repair exonuclease SbcCD ATPase subunit [Aequitasia blattaphilus]|uniref:Phage scaffolding protein n=1 Tax=Aequitasia blattaphilus TaxID=2949332 RepID=A0ABT1ECB6_9FIRM|nr:phage scaffolding protein [Aequitasia blattaphilus]MCP1102587.1 phage scaffolding protein [Aequitasia blattaphilus]MCR8615227.1 phage scaffolding protein [Aequitasia blattaphilus]
MTFKEYLLKQGLSEEQAEAIVSGMPENKFYLANEEKLGERYEKLKGQKEQLEEQLQTNQTELNALKEAAKGNEELTKQLETLQEKFNESEKTYQEALTAKDMDYALRLAIKDAKALDADIVLGQIDKDTVKLVDGKLQGFEEQLNGLKENKAFLFQHEESIEPEVVPPQIVHKGNPTGGNSTPNDPFEAKLAKYE